MDYLTRVYIYTYFLRRVRGTKVMSGQRTLKKKKYGSFASEKNEGQQLRAVRFFRNRYYNVFTYYTHATYTVIKRFAWVRKNKARRNEPLNKYPEE